MTIDDMPQEVRGFLTAAIDEAMKRNHGVVEPEHLLWVDLIDEASILQRAILDSAGDKAQSRIGKLKDRVAKELDKLGEAESLSTPTLSKDSLRCVEAKAEATSCEILAAVAELEDHRLTSLFWQLSLDGTTIRGVGGSVKALADAGVLSSATDALGKYCNNLNDLVAKGKIQKCIGREEVIRELAIILSQRSINNGMLVGDPGVGKTAIVEGLAWQIVNGESLPTLRDKTLMALDIGSLIAGTSYRGEFENRMKSIITELAAADGEIILFIDEIHNLMGAGASGSGPDAANLLKPALARGELWVIGATTYMEYRQYIEKDPALVRRFQRVTVPEPTRDETVQILNGVMPGLADFHGATYHDDAIDALIDLSARYLGDERFPAKAVRLLDRLGAERSVARSEDEDAETEVSIDDVCAVIGRVAGVPVNRLSQSDQKRLLELESVINADLFGQEQAVRTVCNRLRNAAVNANSPHRPRAVFMFAGPSGVGKTELAKLVAREVFGTVDFMTRIDMSEYSSKENANRLIGAPPGTVGYEEGGVLTEAVKRHPYSIVLLDEFEKADPNVWKLFLQVFDAGQLTDNQGTTVNFKNTIFVMTTNMGAEAMYGKTPDEITDEIRADVRERLMTRMPRELFLRIDDVTVFDPLRQEHARLIVRKVFKDTRKRILEAPAQICEIGDITMSEAAVDHLIVKGFEPDSGARAVQSYFDRHLVSLLSRSILEAPGRIELLHLDVEDDQFLVRV